MSDSYNGPPMGQPSAVSSTCNGPPLGQPSAATGYEYITGMVVPTIVASLPPLPTTLTAVSPEMPAVDNTRRSAGASSEALMATTVEDGTPPSWKMVGGVAMTPPDWKMACGVAKKPDGYSLSLEEDDEDSFPPDVDFADTLSWMRSEAVAYDLSLFLSLSLLSVCCSTSPFDMLTTVSCHARTRCLH
jgi:hypothetical protein